MISRLLLIAVAGLALAVPAALGATPRPDRLPLNPTRSCPQVNFVFGGQVSLLEIDVFGRPAPTCHAAVAILRRASTQLPLDRWRRLGRWRCIRTIGPAAECKHGRIGVRHQPG
jgi:hypothetical protein